MKPLLNTLAVWTGIISLLSPSFAKVQDHGTQFKDLSPADQKRAIENQRANASLAESDHIFKRADEALALGNVEQAQTLCWQGITLRAGDKSIRLAGSQSLAECLMARGQYEKAITEFEFSTRNVNYSGTVPAAELALCYLKLNQPDDARRVLEGHAKSWSGHLVDGIINPAEFPVCSLQTLEGFCYYLRGAFPVSTKIALRPRLADLEKAKKLLPGYTHIDYLIGDAEFRLDRFADAKREWLISAKGPTSSDTQLSERGVATIAKIQAGKFKPLEMPESVLETPAFKHPAGQQTST